MTEYNLNSDEDISNLVTEGSLEIDSAGEFRRGARDDEQLQAVPMPALLLLSLGCLLILGATSLFLRTENLLYVGAVLPICLVILAAALWMMRRSKRSGD